MGRRKSNWISRQKSDKYYRKSKTEGHRARSYYKLEQIDRKFHILDLHLRKPPKILDLGAAPGAWLEYIAHKYSIAWNLEKIPPKQVIGIDLNTIQPFPLAPFIYTERINIFKGKCQRFLQEHGPFDVILSDLAPKTAGDHRDIAIQSDMIRKLNDYLEFLKPNGKMVCKVFQSSESYHLFQMFKPRFFQLDRMKPSASRSSSREIYFIGQNFKG